MEIDVPREVPDEWSPARLLTLLTGVLLVLMLAPAGPLSGQGLRGWASTTVRYVEMQPLQLDTALASEIIFDSNGDARVDGRLVRCPVTQATCTYYRPAPVQEAVLGTQDVGITAWGLGMQGLSFTLLVRVRDHLSGELEWPLYRDRGDLMVGYAELRRGAVRIRAGRQESTSGLGFTGFDGGSVRYDGLHLWAEGFGGRSLARGLSETRREALRGIDDFVLDQEAYLYGAAAGFRWSRGDLGLRYQREIMSDRSGLVSERAAMDFNTLLPGGVRVRSSVDYDVPFDRIGKAHLTLQRGLLNGRLLAEVEGRRYVPYFELSTIWGFFNPVPFHEARIRVSGGLGPGTGFRLALAAREYDETNTTTIFRPLEDRGYRAEAQLLWSPTDRLQLDLGYDLDWGAATFLHAFDGSAAVEWSPSLRTRLFATSFQQFEAFRLGEGRAIGGGLGVEWTITERVRLDGMWSLIRNDGGRGGPGDVWNQNRATFGLRYEFGSDPGLRRRR